MNGAFRSELAACAGRVAVVDPERFRTIRKSVGTTDRKDARAPAFFPSEDVPPQMS